MIAYLLEPKPGRAKEAETRNDSLTRIELGERWGQPMCPKIISLLGLCTKSLCSCCPLGTCDLSQPSLLNVKQQAYEAHSSN